MITRQAFTRPAQQFIAFALSALFTVMIFTSVNELAAQPAQDAQLARSAAPAARPGAMPTGMCCGAIA